jgi:hypothetical protein
MEAVGIALVIAATAGLVWAMSRAVRQTAKLLKIVRRSR